MANWLQRFKPKSAFARGVGVLVGGTAGAQALMVLAAPLLTRLYSPDDFGLLAVYSGLLAICTVIAGLRYELAIPLPKSNAEAANVVVLSLVAVALTSTVVALAAWVWGSEIAATLEVPRLAEYFWLLPLGVLLIGTYQVFNYWAIRTKEFKAIAQTRITQTLGTLAVQLLGYKAGGFSLLLGQAGGQSIGSYRLARSAFTHPDFKRWSWDGVLSAAKSYRRFPIFSTWGALFNVAGRQLPPLMFAAFFGGSAAGLYALAHRVLAMPMTIIGNAVGNVFFSNAAEANREGRLGSLVTSVHEKLSQIAMPAAVVLVVAGPELFSFVFGPVWEEAGIFARWMAPWLYMVFITSPLSTLFSVLHMERQGMLFQAGLFVARVIAICIGAWMNSMFLSVLLFSLVSTIFWGGFLAWVSYATGGKLRDMALPSLISLAISSVCILPVVIHSVAQSGAFGGVVATLLTATFFFIYYTWLARRLFN